ncbi:MAG: FAD-dependent monooxygenase [Promethearchaeota archaeon]
MNSSTSLRNNSDFYDFIIVGAGPAGLTAAIVAARNGCNVIVLEKGIQVGPKPRGETLHNYSLIDEILGEGFLKSISKHNTPLRLFHSPKNLKQSIINVGETSYIFEWRIFINKFVEIASSFNIKIKYNNEVIEPIIDKNNYVGIRFKDKEGKLNQVYGNVIFGCDGHNSIIGRYFKIDYSKVNNPIIKCLVNNANIEISKQHALELFLIANGELDYKPDFPPCVLFMFPRGGKEIEVGLMLFMSIAPKIRNVKIPDEQEIIEVWNKIKKNYPGFNEFFKGASIIYEELTAIPSANFVKDYIPYPGIILIGDSAGFVEASGSSGIYSSMAMAKFWASSLSKKIKAYLEDGIERKSIHEKMWTHANIQDFKNKFENSEIYKHIMKTYGLINAFLYKIFKTKRTAEKINEIWDSIIDLLKNVKSG